MSDDTEFVDIPTSTIQTGATPVQHLTPQPVPEEFQSFNSPFENKRYILVECKQDHPEEIACFSEEDAFKDSCQAAQYNIETDEPPDPSAFMPPDIEGLGNIGELESGIEQDARMPDPNQHKFQDSRKPMHAPTGKYHIMELFWFLNPRYTTDLESIPLEEAHFCQLSYNIDFGNLKVTFYKVPNGALEGHKIYLMSCKRMTSVSIYPSSLFKVIRSDEGFRANTGLTQDMKPITVTCMEQLIFNTGEAWQHERPMAIFVTDNNIRLTIRDPKYGDSFYLFQNWQKDALIQAANFVLNQGLVLTGQNIIAGNRVG